MKKFILLTDACCDITDDQRKEWGIECLPMTITDGKEEFLFCLKWDRYSVKEYYDEIRAGKRFSTSLITVSVFEDFFREAAGRNCDVLYLATSSTLSGCYNSACVAADSLGEEFPDSKFMVIDTRRSSLGLGLILNYAATMRDERKSITEIADWVTEHRMNFHQVGSVDDLVYLKRAGRVTGFAAFMSGLLNIKPIIISNFMGENESVAKLRGRKNSIKACVNLVAKYIINPKEQTIFLTNSDCTEDALEIKQMLLDVVGCKDVMIGTVGPVTGASIGPGMFGIYFYGQKIDENFGKSISVK